MNLEHDIHDGERLEQLYKSQDKVWALSWILKEVEFSSREDAIIIEPSLSCYNKLPYTLWLQVAVRPHSLWRLQGRIFLASPSFWWPLAFLGCGNVTLSLASVFTCPSSLFVSLCVLFFLLQDTLTLIQYDLISILTLSTFAKTLFPNTSEFWGPRWTCIFKNLKFEGH